MQLQKHAEICLFFALPYYHLSLPYLLLIFGAKITTWKNGQVFHFTGCCRASEKGQHQMLIVNIGTPEKLIIFYDSKYWDSENINYFRVSQNIQYIR